MRISEIAELLGRPLEGDAEVQIQGVAALDDANSDELAFARETVSVERCAASAAGALIAPVGLEVGERPVIRSPNPALDFARFSRHLASEQQPRRGVSPQAWVDPSAELEEGVRVAPGCLLGARVRVGEGTVLHANVVLYNGVELGSECVIHAGCVLREGSRLGDRVVLQPGVMIGGDGFGYEAGDGGRLEKGPQVGGVVIEDDVEIGSNTTVDRGSLGDTRIGRGTKIDNLVQIGHNCDVGEDVVIIAQAGLSGSTRIERGAIVMAQAGIVGHVTVGERAVVGPQSGVMRDVPAKTRVLGSPEREGRLQTKIVAALPRLPDLLRRVRELEKRLKRLNSDES
ncbi:UDP-3-O-(3-hydroxymyristoyl)glucosamine N-acyltransferase [Myxococcota bacterium]|nr:UDP-3-O-(3-hydroxymyristoyl)glucosamine N-acyltransferase [Myxococcota bacterium]